MKEFLKKLAEKLTSRKFLMCAAVVGVGIMMASGVTTSQLTEIIGMLTTLFGGLTYVVTESGLDKASMKAEIAKAEAAKAEAEMRNSEIKAGLVKPTK